VVKYVLHFAYTGDINCSFEGNGPLLFQLLRLCGRYQLPAVLSQRAQDLLLHSLHDPMCGLIIPTLMRDAKDLKLSTPARQFVARHFITQDAAWHAAAAEDRSELLCEAIGELEPCFSQRSNEDLMMMNSTMGSMSATRQAAMGQDSYKVTVTGSSAAGREPYSASAVTQEMEAWFAGMQGR